MDQSFSENKTASALITAAGRLFAVKGLDSVTTRDISAEAGGIDISLIKYHFGNKDGLLKAVAVRATASLQNSSLEEYYAENKSLLSTRDGQVIFVSGMVDVMFHRFHSEMPEPWCKGFLLQILQKHGENPMRKSLIETYMKPMVSVFARVFREITGNDDFETAFCWYLFITAQLFIYSGDSDLINLLHPGNKVGVGFSRRLLHFCTQQVLNGFGLVSREGV